MKSGRSAAESVKESAADAAASAKAGMEKAKASAAEKAERMRTSDPAEKEAATLKKEDRKAQAQLNKEEAHAHNEEARRMAEAGGLHPGYKTWGSEGYTDTGAAGTRHEGFAPSTGATDTTTVHPRPARGHDYGGTYR